VFAVIVTGAPGAGKTVALTALSDSLVAAGIEHAAVDVDEVAWAYPYPDLAGRCEHLRSACESHRRVGRELMLVAEVIESPSHLVDVLAAIGADAHLLVRLRAEPATMRARILAREPEDWPGLDHLLGEVEPSHAALDRLDGIQLTLDSEQLAPAEIAARIRDTLPG
jgi:broad-specificity NMP kinase